jgi:16S rRNA (cytidine1402-2'-O)-methyltransferase
MISPASKDPASLPHRNTFLLAGQVLLAPRIQPGLHVVATPIGNLGDVTVRALETLAGADLVACEDTRVTHRLMERYGIATPLAAYHDHNAESARPRLLALLAEGGALALVSDAGTPLVSDPGFKLVREVSAAGFNVTALPGPSSVLTALSLSALPTDRFFFEGFLPAKQTARRARLAELARIDATLVLFESGARVQESLRDLTHVMGSREAAICRELTKLHEEVRRAPLSELAATADDLETRGEFVLVIGPPAPDTGLSEDALDDLLRTSLARGSVRDAVAHAVEVSGRPRRDIYARALELAKDNPARDSDDAE